MMLPWTFFLLQTLTIISSTSAFSYPIYGTQRYGRSTNRRYDPYQTMTRTQRLPMNYYNAYPYSQAYADDYYYPQETYPIYYPPARTSKYEVYQAVLPFYYQEPIAGPSYYGYNEPITGDSLLQQAELEQREQSEPIGHEVMYENENANDDTSLDDANAAFLQNLIMSQMYRDSINSNNNNNNDDPSFYDPYDYDDNVKYEESTYSQKPSNREDEDVRELKQLTQQHKQKELQKMRNKQKSPKDDIHWFKQRNFNNKENKRSSDDVLVYNDRKATVKLSEATSQSPSSTSEPKRGVIGQKEEILMRPATPVRRPFSNSVLKMISNNEIERKRTPSAYETIRHLLDTEKSMENKQDNQNEVRPAKRKRIVSSEESLTRQLSVLKKAQ